MSKTLYKSLKVGDIQTDNNGSEWVIVGISNTGYSRVKRNSLAHLIHSSYSPEIAKAYVVPWGNSN